jgi:hypothetical protein
MDMGSINLLFIILLICFGFFTFFLIGKSKKKKCPTCKNEIYDSVVVCKYCKTTVDFSPKPNKWINYLHKQTEKEFIRKKGEDQNRRHNLMK